MDYKELKAVVLDLQRHVRDLEREHYGAPKTSFSPHALESLYRVATSLKDPTQETAALWNHTILSLSTANLITLARRVDDPFCWKVLFSLLQNHAAAGYDTCEPFVHLWSRVDEMLTAMGLSLLRPEDMMGTPTKVTKFKDYVIQLRMGMNIV